MARRVSKESGKEEENELLTLVPVSWVKNL